MNNDLTQAYLKSILHYCPKTGVFTRLVSRRKRWRVGDIAGCRKKGRYTRLNIDGNYYQAHRLAWLYVHGVWPIHYIDHINGLQDDNRLVNLREASQSNNMANSGKHCDNKSGYKGVTANGNGWSAQIAVNKRRIYLGTFASPEEAYLVYCHAATEFHKEYANYG